VSGYDTIIIGSGFGGSLIADVLVRAGERVLMIERGSWVPRDERNWGPDGAGLLTAHYSRETPYEVEGPHRRVMAGSFNCVGGPSVFYGGASLRLRESDFAPNREIVGDSGAAWPINYQELEPFYTLAERILDVAGSAGVDPTEPPRSASYPQAAPPFTETAALIAGTATELDLHPFSLPLAINYGAAAHRATCVACATCDGFACAIGAKNDLATTVIPELIELGMELRVRTVAVQLVERRSRIVAVRCVDADSGRTMEVAGHRVILAAGALGSPHLLLGSALDRVNPAGHTIGRFLLRHRNELVLGIFPTPPGRPERFHKQVAIHDFYDGHRDIPWPRGRLGGLQQFSTPTSSIVRAYVGRGVQHGVMPVLRRTTGMLVLAEDQPSYDNHVRLDATRRDRFGLPQLIIRHRYSARDVAAARALAHQAKRILRRAGARLFFMHHLPSFSHAVGTVRFGADERTSPLDANCRFRGLENLYVVDGSFMPRAGGVNPSLTIAANALRVGSHLVGRIPSRDVRDSSRSRRPSLAGSPP
jgi:choline dehydrogenase-like flavoprotein